MAFSKSTPEGTFIQTFFGNSPYFKLHVYLYVYRTKSQYTAEHTFVIFLYNVRRRKCWEENGTEILFLDSVLRMRARRTELF